jgi:hypothetical protein
MIFYRKLLLTGLCFTLLALQVLPFHVVWAETTRRSAIQKLAVMRQAELFLPSQIVLGQEMALTVRAQPNTLIKIFYDFQWQETPVAGLHLSKDSAMLEGQVPENGVLIFTVKMPLQEALVGRTLYFEAFSQNPSEAALPVQSVVCRNASGVPMSVPSLVVVPPETQRGGPSFMPSMPGLDANMMRQIGTMSSLHQSNDARKLDLIKDQGKINRDSALDRNAFVRPGAGLLPNSQ